MFMKNFRTIILLPIILFSLAPCFSPPPMGISSRQVYVSERAPFFSMLYNANAGPFRIRKIFCKVLPLRSFGDQSDHDFIQSQPAGSNCFETKQCQNLKQYNHDCFDCQRNARFSSLDGNLKARLCKIGPV